MGVIVLEGLVVTLLVVVGLREAIMRAVPTSLKYAIGVGIGLFILFIGFIDAGVIVKTGGTSAENPVPTTLVFPTTPGQFLFWCGLALTVALWARKVPAALLIRSWSRRSSPSSPGSSRCRPRSSRRRASRRSASST